MVTVAPVACILSRRSILHSILHTLNGLQVMWLFGLLLAWPGPKMFNKCTDICWHLKNVGLGIQCEIITGIWTGAVSPHFEAAAALDATRVQGTPFEHNWLRIGRNNIVLLLDPTYVQFDNVPHWTFEGCVEAARTMCT